MKLNLGCGDMIMDGYVNVDLYAPRADVKSDVRELPFEDNKVDEIYSSHVIEHFDFHEGFKVLKEWIRVLKPGGWLIIECPDLEASCREFLKASETVRAFNHYPHFFGMPWLPGGAHKFLYTPTQIRWTLECLKMKNIHFLPALRYIGKEKISMKVACQK